MFENLANWLGDKIFMLRHKRYARAAARGSRHSLLQRLPDAHTVLAALRPGSILLFLRGNMQAVIVLGLLALIASGGFRAASAVLAQPEAAPRGGRAHNIYYFDLGTNALYSAPSTSPTPMPAPSGKLGPNGTLGGVRAYVFACGSCDDPASRFTAYLETIDPVSLTPPPPDPGVAAVPTETETVAPVPTAAAPAAPAKPVAHPPGFGRVIALPEPDPRWISPTSEEGLLLQHQPRKKCAELPAKNCTP